MKVRIRDVIDTLKTPAIDREKTVDQLLYGDPDTEVKQIAVTFLASARVIEEAKKLGVNLIISHEGIYYSHFDRSEMLKSDPVYLSKHKLIEDSGIAIFRNHDHVHLQGYDGITRALVASLGWLDYELESSFVSSVLALDKAMPLKEVISHIKKKLGLAYVRYTGDLETSCRRIGVLVGYRGSGENVIPLVAGKELDLVIYGEGPEWESPEYIKDAIMLGMGKALIVLGHAESEIPGMEQMAKKLQQLYPEIPVHFIRDEEIFKLM
ncbi:MAG: transcriptional regulator [Clostridiales bacterium]|nr:transcriptional regulator [Clostridiales bacterium]